MTLLPTVEVPATPHWGTCYSPRPSLPGTGCRQPPLGTGDPCSSLWEALIDEVYLVSSYKAALRGRRRGWPEARPLPSFRLLDCSLQGPPRFAVVLIQSSHRGFVLPPPTAGSGVSVPSTDARLTETSDPLGPPVHRAGTARSSGTRHTRIADGMQVAPQPGLAAVSGQRSHTNPRSRGA